VVKHRISRACLILGLIVTTCSNAATELSSSTQAKIIQHTLQQNNEVAERLITVDIGREGHVYTGMSFQTSSSSTNFRKIVRVYISDTLLSASSPAWKEIEQKGTIYKYVDSTGVSVEDMDISFPNMASRYIKLKFEDDELSPNQIDIVGVYMRYERADDITLESENSTDLPLQEVDVVPKEEGYTYLLSIGLIVFVALLGYLGYTWTRKV